jgi:hypothetical protein
MKQVADQYPNSMVFWIDSASLREPVYDNLSFPDVSKMDETFLPARASHQMVFAMWR